MENHDENRYWTGHVWQRKVHKSSSAPFPKRSLQNTTGTGSAAYKYLMNACENEPILTFSRLILISPNENATTCICVRRSESSKYA